MSDSGGYYFPDPFLTSQAMRPSISAHLLFLDVVYGLHNPKAQKPYNPKLYNPKPYNPKPYKPCIILNPTESPTDPEALSPRRPQVAGLGFAV